MGCKEDPPNILQAGGRDGGGWGALFRVGEPISLEGIPRRPVGDPELRREVILRKRKDAPVDARSEATDDDDGQRGGWMG